MKLNEGQGLSHWGRIALATILAGCVANTAKVRPTDCVSGTAVTDPNVAGNSPNEREEIAESLAGIRCAPMSYLRCDDGHCRWQQGHIGLNQDLYSSLYYQDFRNSTVNCDQIRISSPRELTCNQVDRFEHRGDYATLKLMRQHFSTHPAIQQLWENTAFVSFPQEEGIIGSWVRLPNSSNNPASVGTSNSEVKYLVNVRPKSLTADIEIVATVIHEMGHGIFEIILNEDEKREFTDLIFEIEDIVDLNEARAAHDISLNDFSSFLDAESGNDATIGALPNAQLVANAFYLERNQIMQTLLQESRLSGAAAASFLRRSEENTTDISRDNLKIHKLYAMSYFMRIALTLYQMMNSYDELGNRSCRQSNFINIEAYAYMFSFSGCMSDLFAPYFKPYLSDTGWQLRQYAHGAGNEIMAHNAYLYTPEGRAEIRREFRAFWRQLQMRPRQAIPRR